VKLWVEPMDVFVVGVTPEGHIEVEGEAPAPPTLQERRAILYAAQHELEALKELVEILENS